MNKKYEQFVSVRCGCAEEDRKLLAAMGLAGEAGEVLEIWKKHLIMHKPLVRPHLVEEMGDVAWYYTLMMLENNITLEEILQGNMDKLRARYGR